MLPGCPCYVRAGQPQDPVPEFTFLKTGALFPVLPHNLLPSRAIGYPQSKLHSTGRFISSQNAPFPYLELK